MPKMHSLDKHVLSHSSFVKKLFVFPKQPLYVNIRHDP